MSVDSRGIRRGGCADHTCLCAGYDGGAEKKKCVKCGHPPGKHHNLDNPTSGFPNSSPSITGTSVQHAGSYCMPPRPPPNLPLCQADGCNNQVWYEFGLHSLQEDLRAFPYCSPECRDRHLLPIRRRELQRELEEMKYELQRVAAKDSPKAVQRQQSFGQSSTFPGLGHSQSSPSTSNTTPIKAQGGKTRKKIMIEKKPRKPSGLILSKKPYVSDKAELVGFIIVGVVKDAAVYSKVQDDQIRLLDVIETVNDTPCSKLLLPGMDLQERFEHSIEERDHVTLELNRCIALPPVSRPLACAKKSVKFTYVTVLMYSAECEDGSYGLSLNPECRVRGSMENSPSDLSKVKYEDKIAMYVVVAPKDAEIRDGQQVNDKLLSTMKQDLQTAHRQKNNVILFVKRSEGITYI